LTALGSVQPFFLQLVAVPSNKAVTANNEIVLFIFFGFRCFEDIKDLCSLQQTMFDEDYCIKKSGAPKSAAFQPNDRL
jgi:hypothetical protein